MECRRKAMMETHSQGRDLNVMSKEQKVKEGRKPRREEEKKEGHTHQMEQEDKGREGRRRDRSMDPQK